MGRKGKESKNAKCITININGMFHQINLNSQDRIENENDLNIIPFLFNQNARRKVKKTRRTNRRYKNIKPPQNEEEKKEQIILSDGNFNKTFEENNFIDNSTVNETLFINENDQIDIFDEFDRYEDFYYDEDENNDLIFNFEQSQYY